MFLTNFVHFIHKPCGDTLAAVEEVKVNPIHREALKEGLTLKQL